MSELYNLISNIVKKELGNFNSIQTVPCRVIDVLSNGTVQVELISTKARYIVANCSGSTVSIGETVQLYYRGIISNHTAYIGASFYKAGTTGSFIMMDSKTGLTSSQYSTISSVDLKAINDTNIEITYNASVLGTNNGEVEFVVYIDDIEQEYKPLLTVVESSITTISFSIPAYLLQGKHNVKIYARGTASIERVCAFISGQVEKIEVIFDDVSDDDFIYITNDSNVDIVLYIGDNNSPKIPDTINGKPIGKLYASAFNVSDIEAVYIPDGVTEIE